MHFIILCLIAWCCMVEGSRSGNVALNSDTQLTWFVDDATGTLPARITFHLEVNVPAWVGIGWHALQDTTDLKMEKADFLIAQFTKDGKVSVGDYHTNPQNAFTAPLPDRVNDVLSFDGVVSSNGTTVTFSRALSVGNNTNDDEDIPIVPGQLNVIWAHGKSGSLSLSYHGNNAGSLQLDFFTGQSKVVKDKTTVMKEWHGSLMIISFAICMSFGIFVARYIKDYYWWFPLHIILQATGVLLSIVGFGLAVAMTEGSHFSTLHSWFGLVTLCLSVVAPALGVAADMTYEPTRDSPPWWPDIFHWWSGRFTVILAYVTIILGLRQFGAPVTFQLAFGGLVVFYMVIYVFIQVYRWKNAQAGTGEHGSLLKAAHHDE